jgi:glycosyltransferase involved in cell wall biosynthesis
MKQLRIGISARGLNSHFSGPLEYIKGFTNALVNLASQHEIFVYYNTSSLVGGYPQAVERVLEKSPALVWDHLQLPLALARDQVDVAIFPKGAIPFFSPCRSLSIMLDMGYFHPHLNAYKPMDTLYNRIALRHAAKYAWGIFTISQYTADDAMRLFNVPQGKIQNIYGGVGGDYKPVEDESMLDDVRARYRLHEPFIFYPTSISPRKNITRVLDAFEQVQNSIPHHLYFTGKASWNSPEVEERLNGAISARVRRLGAIPPQDMPALYTLADFTIYPSLFEGLGLPVLEAFRCGSPVLTSDQSSLPEVAGDAALIVDGYSADAIAAGLLKMANDKKIRAELRERGFLQAQKFTWENTARTALDWIHKHWD